MIPMGDLAISLQDMVKCMKNADIQTSMNFYPTSDLEPKLILLIMKTLETSLEKANFSLNSIKITISDIVCFEITGTNHEFASCFLEDGYRVQMEKIPMGYRLMILQDEEVVQL